MEIGQWITTFSTRGLNRNSSGDGVYSYSPDMENAIRKNECPPITGIPTLENKGDLSEIPDIMRVNTSKRANDIIYISNSHFVGRAYNDSTLSRGNNYISHCLRIKQIDRYPIEFYGSQIFRRGLTPEEDQNPILLKDLTTAESGLGREEVKAFLEKDNRIHKLCYLLEAVLNRDKLNLVIIYDDKENIPLWIAAVQMSLPLRCALSLSFCTFCPNPLNYNYDIRGVARGFEDKDIEEYKKNGQHFIFDAIHNDLPNCYPGCYTDERRRGKSFGELASQDYYRMVRQAWSGSIQLDDFFRFVESFSYNRADVALKNVAVSYQMTEGKRLSKMSFDAQEAAFTFNRQYGDKQKRISLLKEMLAQLLCEYYSRSKEKGSDSALKNLYDSYIISYDQGDFRSSRDEQAELLLKLYYLLVIDYDNILSASEQQLEMLPVHADQIKMELAEQSPSALEQQLEMLSVHAAQIKMELAKQLISEETLLGCYRKNNSKEELTKSTMLLELAENCQHERAFGYLRRLLKYQAMGRAADKSRRSLQKDIAGWVKATERIYGKYGKNGKEYRSGIQALSFTVESVEQAYQILLCELLRRDSDNSQDYVGIIQKFCEKKYDSSKDYDGHLNDFMDDGLEIISGYYVAEILKHTRLEEQALAAKYYFKEYFSTPDKWEFFSPAIGEFLLRIESGKSKEDVCYRELIYLFNELCSVTNYQLKSEAFRNLIYTLADKTILTNKKRFYSSSDRMQQDETLRKTFKHLETYCERNNCYMEPDYKKLRYFAYLYQVLNISQLGEWRDLWDIYKKKPVETDFLNDSECKLYFDLLSNMSETTIINYSGYCVLLKGIILSNHMIEDARMLVRRYFQEQSRDVRSKDDMLNLLGLLAVSKDQFLFYSAIKEEFNSISQKKMDRMRDLVRDICQTETKIPAERRNGMNCIWQEYTRDYRPDGVLRRWKRKVIRG